MVYVSPIRELTNTTNTQSHNYFFYFELYFRFFTSSRALHRHVFIYFCLNWRGGYLQTWLSHDTNYITSAFNLQEQIDWISAIFSSLMKTHSNHQLSTFFPPCQNHTTRCWLDFKNHVETILQALRKHTANNAHVNLCFKQQKKQPCGGAI